LKHENILKFEGDWFVVGELLFLWKGLNSASVLLEGEVVKVVVVVVVEILP